MRVFTYLAAFMLAAFQATSAQAHPGHGPTDPNTPAHFLLEPLHIMPIMGIAAAALYLGYRAVARQRQSQT